MKNNEQSDTSNHLKNWIQERGICKGSVRELVT